MGALGSIIQTDLKNFSEVLQLLFFLFLEIGHVTDLPMTHCMDPDTQNHHDFVCLDFLATMCDLPYLEMCTDHVNTK